jgi:SAM-dependent methyltransferase
MSIYSPHLKLAQEYWASWLKAGDTVIDATCGNGKDTQILASLVPQGRVYSLDIQAKALEKAQQHVSAPNVVFLLQSHADFPLSSGVKLVVYNLGYLPGGDKSVTTRAETTLVSVSKAVEISKAVSITCYPGHEEGAKEAKAVWEWAQNLDPKRWKVDFHQWKPLAPSFLFISKH